MAYQSDHRSCSPVVVRCSLFSVVLLLVFFIVGRPILWFLRANSHSLASCQSCDCDCSSDEFSMPLGFLNSSYSDCGKDDPEVNEELEKDMIGLLSEELGLLKSVSRDHLARTKELIMDTKRSSWHYQKEAEKCNAGVETCEEAREKAEAAIMEERKLSALWEERARDLGWKDERTFS